MDDTVLEEHNEDPALVQMKLLGDGGKIIIAYYRYSPWSGYKAQKWFGSENFRNFQKFAYDIKLLIMDCQTITGRCSPLSPRFVQY